MSLPYLQPYLGLSNGLNTLHAAGGPGGTVGGWVELARTTLGSAGDIITVSSLPNKRYYMILTDVRPTSAANPYMRLGSSGTLDTGSNYSERIQFQGGSEVTYTSSSYYNAYAGGAAAPSFWVQYLANYASKEKLSIMHGNYQGSAGAASVPVRFEVSSKWANTSNAIDVFQLNNTAGGNRLTAGSEVVVLGWDPADSHTNNYWEEIGSATGTGIEDITLSSTKKYIWFQAFIKSGGASGNFQLRAGNGSLDTGSNYSERRSTNGGGDATGTSQTSIGTVTGLYASGDIGFLNGFIINNANNEKLFICHITDNTPGSGATTAPNRRELVGKWANTSNAIDHLGYLATSGSVHADSVMKVWGAD